MREMWVQACVPGHHFSSLPFEGFSGDMSPFFFFRKCMGEVCSYAYSDGSKTKGGQSPQAFSMGKSFEIGLSGYAYAPSYGNPGQRIFERVGKQGEQQYGNERVRAYL